jgi:hypothetical protein
MAKAYDSAHSDNATHRALSRARAASEENRKRGGKQGRLKLYRDSFTELAYKFCMLGADNKRLGELFGVDMERIEHWIATKRDFREAVQMGREIADAEIAHALYHRAKGYSHKAEKIFYDGKAGDVVRAEYTEHYPPDTQAASFWLRNRHPEKWREKTEVAHDGGGFSLHIHSGDDAAPAQPAIEQSPPIDVQPAAITIEDE